MLVLIKQNNLIPVLTLKIHVSNYNMSTNILFLNKYFVPLAVKLINDAVIIENLTPRTFDDLMPTSNLGSMFMSECTQ